MVDETGTSQAPQGRRPLRTIGIVVVLLAVVLIFMGPKLMRRFEEPPVVNVCDILRGEVDSDIVMVRGIVQRERSGQGYIFLGDVEERDEILVDGISMLPVARVQSWAWFNVGQEVRLPVLITQDADGNLLLVETRRRGERDCRVRDEGSAPDTCPEDSALGAR
jgi:hypothetical protein